MSRSRPLILIGLLLFFTVPGMAYAETTITLGNLRVVTTPATIAAPATGALYIDSVPPGALVSLDDNPAGTTPVTLATVAAGWHTITLTLAGYSDYTDRVQVPAGGSVREVYTLTSLQTTATPTTATPTPVPTVTCVPPCECLLPAEAQETFGNYTQCIETPCGYETAPTGAQQAEYCFRPAETPVTTTPTTAAPTTTPITPILPVTTLTTPVPTTTKTLPVTTVPPVVPATTTQPVTPVPTQPPAKAANLPKSTPLISANLPSNLCQFDTATGQCTGTCPLTGMTCTQVKQSACGDAGAGVVKCGCVDTHSSVSLAAAGLLSVQVQQPAVNRSGTPFQRGPVDWVIRFFTGILNPRPSISSADPRLYTRDSVQAMSGGRRESAPPVHSRPPLCTLTVPPGSSTRAQETRGAGSPGRA